ncbi:zinc finger BED domain-containing protein RICESLEEPER 2-like [Miscanthus floridulus]|uniref:zinc finger BED domain-containing protein RICESLEEPER 2-like n=1 Tax=Miscanthus floridulus TaxID=154761 RepID=UPI003457FC9A
MAEDDGELPPGMAPEGENDDDIHDDTAALFGVDLGDGNGGEGATASANLVSSNSNGSVPSVAAAGNGKVGKRKSPVWDDFEEIFETMNGEDYISVVVHYVSADWELQKKEFGMIDKIYSVTLDNASSNAKAMETLTPMFVCYLGSDPAPTPSDPNKQDFRTAIKFLNSSNHRIVMFKNYCNAQGVRPRKFGLDMDVRWNDTYLMLKHLLPYKEVFSVFINANFGCTLLTPRHWLIAAKILEFLELFYESTCVLSGVYYPTSPLILHHMLDIAHHLHESEKDQNIMAVVYPMKLKYLKYWENIPLLYSIAFILDPRAKLRGLFNVLVILKENTGVDYSKYYADVKTEIYKLFAKYDSKYGSTRSQRPAHPAVNSGKRKQAWGRIFGGPGSSAVVGPPPLASVSTSTQSAASVACELTTYLDSDNVTAYEDDFDLLLWWRDHKLIYPVLSIMARDIMVVSVSTVSSESCFSLTGRIIEERRRRLLPKHVEMLACIKDWELGDRRLQHSADNQELAESFENLYLDVPEDGSGPPSASTSASASVASASAAT